MPQIRITTKKDGRQVAWFREDAGRVRTSTGNVDWERADLVRIVGEYGLQLQWEQALAGLGSDGTRMPPLKESGRSVFAGRSNGRVTFVRRGYAQQKLKLGLQPVRDLYGPGIGGHMLDQIRVTYVDDKEFRFGITTKLPRQKALANENRAPWWGWSPQSVLKMAKKSADVFPQGFAQNLVALGLMGTSAVMSGGQKILLRRAA